MVEKMEQDTNVIEQNSRAREKGVNCNPETSHQTNPIVRKLLDFGLADKTRKFSVRDLFTR